MASLKEIKIRIASVNSTKKITSAMRMVSSAKLHHAEGTVSRLLPYQQKLDGLLHHLLAACEGDVENTFAAVRPVRRVALVAFSANSGLCGTFNANVLRELETHIRQYRSEGKEVLLYAVGKKGSEALRKTGYALAGDHPELIEKPTYEGAVQLASELMTLFSGGEVDKIELLYHHFKSAAVQQLTCREWLPIDLSGERAEEMEEYLLEPSAEELLAALLPKVLRTGLYAVLLDTTTAEFAARVLAMQNASENANDLLQDLTLQYNKSRQQAITNELMDIRGGR